MTVIFACTFINGAAIASDTLLHNPETNERVMNAPKVLNISQRVSMAQAGSFTGTQDVWRKLELIPSQTATPTTIAEAIRLFATPIYQQKCRAGGAVMRYLVAGIEADGVPSIHWLEFDRGNFGSKKGPGQIAALGTLPNVCKIATQAVFESIKPFSKTVMLDKWCEKVVCAEATATPHAVGFPAVLILMNGFSGVSKVVDLGSVQDPAYEVRWP
jgi:hypothetical protein